ncbi:hypothetical protein X975_17741, partial [Stegodyphus mimosarum]
KFYHGQGLVILSRMHEGNVSYCLMSQRPRRTCHTTGENSKESQM